MPCNLTTQARACTLIHTKHSFGILSVLYGYSINKYIPVRFVSLDLLQDNIKIQMKWKPIFFLFKTITLHHHALHNDLIYLGKYQLHFSNSTQNVTTSTASTKIGVFSFSTILSLFVFLRFPFSMYSIFVRYF